MPLFFLAVAVLFGFCMTRRTQKKTEITLPPQTVQSSNTTGQLVDNLTATPTPGIVNPNANLTVTDGSLIPNPNANLAANKNPNFVPNSGLYQANQPVTQQTQAFNQQKAMTERGNNPKNIPQYRNSGGGNTGGGNTGGVSGYINDAVNNGDGSPNNSPLAKIIDATTNAVTPNSTRRSKAVFYGGGSNSPKSTSQINQMASILASKNLNFNNIPFGTLLPVRTIGAVHTLLPSSLARMELTQTVKGDGWTLPAGTIIVGQVTQGIGNRVNITPRGFLLNDQFFQIQGEISGTDGGIGLLGERKSVGGKWYRSLVEVADRMQQSFNSWLSGRSGGSVTNIEYPSVSQVANVSQDKVVSYIAVKPNATGYLLVTQLPAGQGGGGGGITSRTNQDALSIPSSIPGFSVDEVNKVLSSGDERAIENLLNRKP